MSVKHFLVAWLAQDDAGDALQLFVVDDESRVHRLQCPCFFEILHSLCIVFEGLEREGATEVGMGVLGVLADHDVEVRHCLFVLVNHLVSFGPLVDVAQVAWDLLDAARVGEDGLFELLEAAVG